MTTTPEIQKLDAPLTQDETIASLGRYGYGWSDSDVAGASAQRGLSEAVVRDISAKKSEPEWMLDVRLKALRTRLAQAQKVPAYVVFSDRTLIELATHRPASPRAMREIHGVGDTKLERYGAAFLDILQSHAR